MQKVTHLDGRVDRTFIEAVGFTDPENNGLLGVENAEERLRKHLTDATAKALADPTVKEIQTVKNIGRNASCPCGSGRKFKKCCITKVQKV